MFLVDEEGTASTFRALREVIGAHGLFCSLYTDRGSHYFYTPKAGEKVSKSQQTQVGRALSHLGIEHIAAYSPEARGRSERMFGTLQGRLPKDLRLAGITTVEAANAWLKAHYIAEHNAAFAIQAEQEGTAFAADRHEAWREALCVIEERTVGQRQHDRLERQAAAAAREPSADRTSSRRWCACTNIPTARRACSSGRTGWRRSALAETRSAPMRPSLAACSGPSRTSPLGRASARP